MTIPAFQIVTATEALRSFSDLLNQVRYQAKSFEIKKGREIIAIISPAKPSLGLKISDLNEFFEHLPSIDKEDANEFNKTLKEIRSLTGSPNWWDNR